MGILPQSIRGLEKSEENGAITLKKLRHVAEAMDCHLVYALLPNISMEETIAAQAKVLALKKVRWQKPQMFKKKALT